MNGDKSKKLTVLFVLSASLAAAALTAVLLTRYYSGIQFQVLGNFCAEIMERHPGCEQTVMEFLKAESSYEKAPDENILMSFGYRQSDFLRLNSEVIWIAGMGFVISGAIFVSAFRYWHKRSAARIKALTDYLEKINTGGQGLLLGTSEDEFSRLQDEIYKTVTTLYQTRDAALAAKNNFAENLANIAHQLKTPITSISLSVQMMRQDPKASYLLQAERQISRLTRLEEALLLLSRIDAGTLTLTREKTDVFTILTLASDNLQELFSQAGVLPDIPETGEIDILADPDWTMEAMMNLMKNCMEASAPGTAVHCSYEQNPLYVQIRIWDEGQGFSKEDLPHLFRRFYRGKNAKGTGIGIGLPLAKAVIEMQNGIISAFNLPACGACFEIRFYSH